MAPKRRPPGSGTIEWVEATSATPAHWKARIRYADGTRPWVHFAPEVSENEASLRAGSAAKTAKVEGWVSTPAPLSTSKPGSGKRETVHEWYERWIAWRKTKGVRTLRDDVSRYKWHIGPTIGAVYVDALTSDDLENVRDDLDRKILTGYIDPRGKQKKMKWRTAGNVWTIVTSIAGDMKSAKERSLRCRTVNLADGIEAPERGKKTAKPFLYPSEFLALVSDERIPLHYRRRYALATYLYVRLEELGALEWRDVDLDHGLVHVQRAEKSDGTMGPPKSGKARRVAIEPTLRPLLVAMFREADHDDDEARARTRVVPITQKNFSAANLRHYMERAIVGAKLHRRDELFDVAETSKLLGFHDLRATGITWRAVRGDAMQAIKEHAGHEDVSTTDGYVRVGSAMREEGFGDVFPPLPASILRAKEERSAGPGRWSRSPIEAPKCPNPKLLSHVPGAGFEPAHPSRDRRF